MIEPPSLLVSFLWCGVEELDMKKMRIPLPKQVEKVHKDEKQYDRKRDKAVKFEA
jgi:hypothetical protein